MRFGPVLTYKDIDKAKKLVGRLVVASNYLSEIERITQLVHPELLKTVHKHAVCPFGGRATDYQFIREILPDKPEGLHFEPYDLSDPVVRKSLRGRWIIWNDGDIDDADEAVIISFTKRDGDPWQVRTSIGSIDATELLKFCVFDDGTPCGRRVD